MLKHWKLALVAASLLVGGVALAQPSGGGAQDQDASAHHMRGKRGEKRAAMLGKYDANKDGKLDAAEKAAMQKDKFARLDKNHDGVLSFDEAQPLLNHRGGRGFHGQRGGERGGKMQKQ